MHTRLITWTNATNIDGGIEYLQNAALPVVRQQKGYRGLSATVDRSKGRMHILSIWESEVDRDASDSALGKVRDEGTEIIGGEMKVEKLEELVSEVVKPPVPGSALMVSPFSMDPATIEENLSFFKNEIVPQIKAAPGFCSLRNMVNRKTGEGYVGTVWVDRVALDKQAEGAAVARRQAASARDLLRGDRLYGVRPGRHAIDVTRWDSTQHVNFAPRDCACST